MKNLIFLYFILLCFISFVFTQSQCIEEISTSTTIFNSSISDIVFTTEDNQEVYVLTSDHFVYHSINGGKSFISIVDELDDFYNYFGTSSFGVRSIIHGADDNLVYFIGASDKIYWVTRGNGLYKSYPTGDDILYDMSPNPQNGDLVLRVIITCLNGDEDCTSQLQVSQNQGDTNTWTIVRNYVYSYSWGVEANQILYVSIPDNLMSGDLPYIPLNDCKIYMTYSLDDSYSFETASGFFAFEFSDSNILYAAKYDNETSLADFYISPDSGESYVEAEFRNGNQVAHIDSSMYIILDDSEGVSFITVCDSEETMDGNLYQADIGDGEYWESVPNLRATCSAYNYHGADFQKINGITGLYISNAYNSEAFDHHVNIDEYIETGFSINKGGSWSRIPAPEGSSCSELPNCYLNLFSTADTETDYIYSSSNAIGIVIATGTEGEYRDDYTQANTYLSRNGGYSWEKIKDGAHKYAQSNHASLFTMLSINPTNELFYSWTQGSDWNSCIFTDNNIITDYIMDISTTSNDSAFIVSGTTVEGNGTVTYFDFATIAPPACDGFNTADSENSDYETFVLESNGTCVLGQQKSYIRRKRDVNCTNTATELSSIEGSCECTRFDYTCDGDCWAESLDNEGNINCINACVGEPNDPEAVPVDCDGTYMKPSGYRLVDGDVCIGGLQLDEPVETACPTEASQSPSPIPLPSDVSPSISPVESPIVSPAVSPSVAINATQTASPVYVVGSYTPVANISITTDPNTDDTNSDGLSIIFILGIIILVIGLLLLGVVVVILVLYKTNPKVRGLIKTYLPASMGGGAGETKLYSVLGDSSENSLFADDDLFVDDNVNVPVSSDNTPLSSLLDFDDDNDAEGAIDIEL